MTETPMTAQWRNIPLFITSTFRDMHAERDYLVKHVFPEITQRLRARRLYLEPIDLRWGVETVSIEAENKKEVHVLRVCLNEIERSRPFQIVLLGDRYGWIPPVERMEHVIAEKGFSLARKDISVTDLEIEFGIFSSEFTRRHCYVYCREPLPYDQMSKDVAAFYSDSLAGDAGAAERLQALKERLKAMLPDRFRIYRPGWDKKNGLMTGLAQFGKQVLEDMWAELDAISKSFESAEPPTWKERQRTQVADFLGLQARFFTGREALLEELAQVALSPETAVDPLGICVTSEEGGGKSALLAKLHSRLSKEDVLLIAHAVGIGERSDSVDAFLLRWIEEIIQSADMDIAPPDNDTATRIDDVFSFCLEQMARQKRIVILVDGLDQLEPTDRGRYLTWMPWRLPPNVRFIGTSLPGDAADALDKREWSRPMALPPLASSDVSEIAHFTCERYHRRLNQSVLDALLAKTDSAGRMAAANPLWLNLAMEKLNLLDSDDFIRTETTFSGSAEQRMQQLLVAVARQFPAEIPEMYRWLLSDMEKAHGDMVRAFAIAVALGRSGWRKQDLRTIVPQLTKEPWTNLAFAGLVRAFRGHLVQKGLHGRWDFTNQHMRKAVAHTYDLNAQDLHAFHRSIAGYLESLPQKDPLRRSELMFHYVRAEDRQRAASYLAESMDDDELRDVVKTLGDYLLADESKQNERLAWIGSLLEVDDLEIPSRALVAHRLEMDLLDHIQRAGHVALEIGLLEFLIKCWTGLCGANPKKRQWVYCTARALLKMGRVQKRAGDYEKALFAYTAALRGIYHPSFKGDDWRAMATTLNCELGNMFAELDAWEHAHWCYDRPRVFSSTYYSTIDDVYANIHRASRILTGRAIHRASFEYFEALGNMETFRQADSLIHEDITREMGLIHARLSQIFRLLDLSGQAAWHIQKAMRIAEEQVRDDPSSRGLQYDLGYYYLWYFDVLEDSGKEADREEALDICRKGLDIFSRLHQMDPHNEVWETGLCEVKKRIVSLRSWIGSGIDDVKEFKAVLDNNRIARGAKPPESTKSAVSSDIVEGFGALAQEITSGESRKSAGGSPSGTIFIRSSPLNLLPEELGAAFLRNLSKDKIPFWNASTEIELADAIKRKDPARYEAWRQSVFHGPTPGDWALKADMAKHAKHPITQREEMKKKGLGTSSRPISLGFDAQALTRSAEEGDSDDQFQLGKRLWNGDEMDRDPEAGIQWLEAAAGQGLGKACLYLGMVVYGHPQSDFEHPERAAAHIGSAADMGMVEAQCILGSFYEQGYGVTRDDERAVAWYLKAAQGGDPIAMHNLGLSYLEGTGVRQDKKKGFEWIRKAAGADLSEACFKLGDLYVKGIGVDKDIGQAAAWFHKAAAKGHAMAHYRLGAIYANETSLGRDDMRAFLHDREAARKGVAEAQYALGYHFIEGRGAKKNIEKGVSWVEKAAEQGFVLAQYDMGVFFSQGAFVDPDYQKAVYWYTEASKQEFPEALVNLGYLYLEGKGVAKDAATGIELIERAANLGNTRAQYELGSFCLDGIFMDRKDPETAVVWFVKAADQGYAPALHNLGHLHIQGEVVEKDIDKGIGLLTRAAEKGFANSQYDLGAFYLSGGMIEKNAELAGKWLRKAADQGLPEAMYNLAQLYQYGEGVEKDEGKALALYEQAAAENFLPAQAAVMKMRKPSQEPAPSFEWAAKKGEPKAQFELARQYYAKETPEGYEQAEYWMAKAADQGFPEAQHALGYLYLEGKSGGKKIEKGIELIEQAARQDLVEAQFNLGVLYIEGNVVEKDPPKGFRWLEKAARNGHPPAQEKLFICYLEGIGVEKDTTKGIEWIEKAAAQGEASAQFGLGSYYHSGKYTEPDYQKAFYWYTRAANAEDRWPMAMYSLAHMYLAGLGVEENREKGIEWLKKAVEMGFLPAQIELSALEGEKAPPSTEALEVAAAAGDPEAQFELGVRNHQKNMPAGFEKAFHWYTKAVEQGHAKAHYNLGYLYLDGYGVQQDVAKGIGLIEKAAGKGLPVAQYELGNFYFEGKLIKKDYRLALYWYDKAANQGTAEAMYNLAHMHLEGMGVEQHPEKGIELLEDAAKLGFLPAQMKLAGLARTQ